MDRIDLHVQVYAVKQELLLRDGSSEPSGSIRERIVTARRIQKKRFNSPITLNTHISGKLIKKYCALDTKTERMLVQASKKFNISARSFYKILKVSRTIADLKQQERIAESDILEALQYRKNE